MTYLMSDLHGNRDAFRRMLQEIALTPDDRLYVLGDAIDRGPDGIALLHDLRSMRNVVFLLGNHEHMMLDTFTEPDGTLALTDRPETEIRQWAGNGGYETMTGLAELTGEAQLELLAWLATRPIAVQCTVGGRRFLLVHGRHPDPALRTNSPEQRIHCLWDRMEPEDPVPDRYDAVIFGHTPTCFYHHGNPFCRIWHGDRKIGIDCGLQTVSGAYGRLACLRLEDMQEFYVGKDGPSEMSATEIAGPS